MEPGIVGEVITLRSRNTKHWARTDGSYLAQVSTQDVHFADASGHWHNIKTALIDEADFDVEEDAAEPVAGHIAAAFQAKAREVRGLKRGQGVDRDKTAWRSLRVSHDVTLPKNLKQGYTIAHGPNSLTFTPVGASPSRGQVKPDDASTIEYQDVWPMTDVRLTVTPWGVKETLVVKGPGGPSVYSTEVQGSLADDLTSGALRILAASLIDDAGIARDVPTVRTARKNRTYVDLTPDYTGLTFPVLIDPSVTISSPSQDAYVDSAYPTNNYSAATTLKTYTYNAGGTYRYAYAQFDLSGIRSVGAVTSAALSISITANMTSGQQPNGDGYDTYLYAFEVSAPWSAATLTYNTAPGHNSGGNYGHIGNVSNSVISMDLTAVVTDWLVNGIPNYGLQFYASGGGDGYHLVEFSSMESATPMTLDIVYTAAPGAPLLTAPNGGETWNAQHTVTWQAATDADTAAASLQYQIQLSTDNQATWSDLVALTAAGATRADVDLSAKPESSTCFVRVRAYDGANYGAWDVSNGAFTIAHNQAPLMPSNLSPSGGTAVDRATVQRLSWQHNDPNSSDPQSKFDLQWSSNGGSTWTTVTQATPNQYWDAPGGTFPHGSIVWRVRTYDQADLSGPYSDQVTFLAGDKPTAPVITSPTDGGTEGTSRQTLQWSASGQVGYQVQALTLAGAVVWDSGNITSTNKAVTIGADLANLTTYTLKVRIRDSDGVWSDYDSISVNVSYTPPATATLTVTPDTASGVHALTAVNPTPTGTEPAVTSNRFERTLDGGTTVTEVATATPTDGTATATDYAAVAGDAQYRTVAIAGNGITTTGDWQTATLGVQYWTFTPLDGVNPVIFAYQDRFQWRPEQDVQVPQTQGRYRRQYRGPTYARIADISARMADRDSLTARQWRERLLEHARAGTEGYLKSPAGDVYRGILSLEGWETLLPTLWEDVRCTFRQTGEV